MVDSNIIVPDIWKLIAWYLDRHDLARLTKCSRAIYSYCLPLLYKNLRFSTWGPDRITATLKLLEANPALAQLGNASFSTRDLSKRGAQTVAVYWNVLYDQNSGEGGYQ